MFNVDQHLSGIDVPIPPPPSYAWQQARRGVLKRRDQRAVRLLLSGAGNATAHVTHEWVAAGEQRGQLYVCMMASSCPALQAGVADVKVSHAEGIGM